MRQPVNTQRGLTLIEVAVVIAVIALLLGTLLPPLVAQLQIREVRDAEQRMRVIEEALIGFAQSQGRLPCPDSDATIDGLESTPCAATLPTNQVLVGRLPWATLGLPPSDRWGRLLVYAVSEEFVAAASPGSIAVLNNGRADLADLGCGTVNDRGNGKVAITVADGSNCNSAGASPGAAAVVVSVGANGHCGITLAGATLVADGWDCGSGPASGTVDEFENVDGDSVFVARGRSEGGAGCDDAPGSAGPLCAFDDLVIWIPTTVLLGKLVQAGWLP